MDWHSMQWTLMTRNVSGTIQLMSILRQRVCRGGQGLYFRFGIWIPMDALTLWAMGSPIFRCRQVRKASNKPPWYSISFAWLKRYAFYRNVFIVFFRWMWIGTQEIDVPCWRPEGSLWEELSGSFLGTSVHLTRESLVFEEAWENRHRLVTCSSGRVRTLVSSTSMRFFSITFAYIFTSLSEFHTSHYLNLYLL